MYTFARVNHEAEARKHHSHTMFATTIPSSISSSDYPPLGSSTYSQRNVNHILTNDTIHRKAHPNPSRSKNAQSSRITGINTMYQTIPNPGSIIILLIDSHRAIKWVIKVRKTRWIFHGSRAQIGLLPPTPRKSDTTRARRQPRNCRPQSAALGF